KIGDHEKALVSQPCRAFGHEVEDLSTDAERGMGGCAYVSFQFEHLAAMKSTWIPAFAGMTLLFIDRVGRDQTSLVASAMRSSAASERSASSASPRTLTLPMSRRTGTASGETRSRRFRRMRPFTRFSISATR